VGVSQIKRERKTAVNAHPALLTTRSMNGTWRLPERLLRAAIQLKQKTFTSTPSITLGRCARRVCKEGKRCHVRLQVRTSPLSVLNIGTRSWHMSRMADKAFGWVVTVTAPHSSGSTARVWYAACTQKETAIEAVKKATNEPNATVEISREMSETLMTAFGLKSGEVRCFD